MSGIQKPEYFMGLQHWEGQSPQAVFANVLMIPLALFRMPRGLCMRPNLQSAAPTEDWPRSFPNPPQHMHVLFLTAEVVCSCLSEAVF